MARCTWRSLVLAVASGVTYMLVAAAVAFGASWAVPAAVATAALGLLLKALYLHPWLVVGVALDALILLSATTGWPRSLL